MKQFARDVMPYWMWVWFFGTAEEREALKITQIKQRRHKIELETGKVFFSPDDADTWAVSTSEADIDYMTGIMYVQPDPVYMGWRSSAKARQDKNQVYPMAYNNTMILMHRLTDNSLLVLMTTLGGTPLWVGKVLAMDTRHDQSWLVVQPIADKCMAETFDFGNRMAYTPLTMATAIERASVFTIWMEGSDDIQGRARRTYSARL